MMLGPKGTMLPSTLNICPRDGTTLEQVMVYKHLGIWLDSELTSHCVIML